MSSLLNWVQEQIKELLGPETPLAYSEYILEIKDQSSLKEYLQQLAGEDSNSSKIESFVELLTARRNVTHENVTIYKKKDDTPEQQLSVKPKKKKEKKMTTLDDFDTAPVVKTPLDRAAKTKETSPKKKTTYVSLYGKDGEDRMHAVLLPGRHPCECQAQKHKLINNCLGCGRVVCEQEGSGPCLFCGKIVCTPEEKKILARESNKSEKLLKKLSTIEGGGSLGENDEPSKGLKRAQDYKNRLLEYDRTYVQRTKVIDDESDFYSTEGNVWLSKKEREAMEKKEKAMREMRFGSRLNRKVTLDFAGRRVIDEDSVILDQPPEEILAHEEEKPSIDPTIQENFPELSMPKFVGKENKAPAKKSKELDGKHHINRLQDKELQTMSDAGMCLSMHQPWASLLVKGIKRDEGRNWYSNHRGRLWIAAASHRPTDEEIQAIEQQHLQFVDRDVEFPKEYPTSCLLGCVNVEDVLSQEDYRKKYPNGESGSPNVFVCSNFEELLLKLPISGKHKIWKLPSNIHQAARKARTIHYD